MTSPFNVFTIHNLIGFMVTGSLAAYFYLVYLKAGRRLLDIISANFIFCAAGLCFSYFLSDNIVPSGLSSYGWPGGPTAEALRTSTLEANRLSWAFAIFLLPAQLHFILCYCQKQNFLRRHIKWAYGLAIVAQPTIWLTPLWVTAPEKAIAATSSWAVTIPWLPTAGPAAAGLVLCTIALEIYGLVQLWKTRRLSNKEFAESLGHRRIVFAALAVQMVVSMWDGVAGAMELPIPAATPLGSGIMGVLLSIALIRSRMAADKARFQLESEKAAVIECVPQPLLYFGNDYRVQWGNSSAAIFAEKSPEQLAGNRLEDILGALAQKLSLAEIEQALKNGTPLRQEIVRNDKSTWMVYMSPTTGKDKSTGAIMLAMDITEIRLAQEALKNTNVMILNAREEECRRVAQDLHDSVAQGLTALQMQLGAVAAKQGSDTPGGQIFDQASKRCGQIGKEVRQISHQLYPPALDLLGFNAAIEEILEQYRSTGVECSLKCPNHLKKVRFPQNVEVALYRTVQEAMNNATRHGKAKEIRIQLGQTDEAMWLSITDNGIGFKVGQNRQGLGMTSMKGRIDSIAGKLDLSSRPGETCIKVFVPLANLQVKAPEPAVQAV